MQIVNCTGSGLLNVNIDYTATLAQGIVQMLDPAPAPAWLVGDFDTALLPPDATQAENFFFRAPYNHSIKIALWNPETRTMLRNTSIPGAINLFFETGMPVGKGQPAGWPEPAHSMRRYNVTFRTPLSPTRIPLPLPTGTLVTIFPRGGKHAVEITGSRHSLLNSVNIYGGSSMAVVDVEGGGGTSLQHVNVLRRPLIVSIGIPGTGRTVDRLHSVNADGFHSTNNAIGPQIVNCEVSYTGDDLCNVCSGISIVLARPNASAVTLIDTGSNLHLAAAGTGFRFFRLNSLAVQGAGTIASVAINSDPQVAAAARQARATLANPPYSATFEDVVFSHPQPYDVVFTTTLPAAVGALWSVAHLESTSNAGALIESCHFHDGYARVIMLKSGNTNVTSSSFARSGGLHLGPEQTWCEGERSSYSEDERKWNNSADTFTRGCRGMEENRGCWGMIKEEVEKAPPLVRSAGSTVEAEVQSPLLPFSPFCCSSETRERLCDLVLT